MKWLAVALFIAIATCTAVYADNEGTLIEAGDAQACFGYDPSCLYSLGRVGTSIPSSPVVVTPSVGGGSPYGSNYAVGTKYTLSVSDLGYAVAGTRLSATVRIIYRDVSPPVRNGTLVYYLSSNGTNLTYASVDLPEGNVTYVISETVPSGLNSGDYTVYAEWRTKTEALKAYGSLSVIAQVTVFIVSLLLIAAGVGIYYRYYKGKNNEVSSI